MQMRMVVFRASLRERVHTLLHQCDVCAFSEVPDTVGYGQTGPAEGLAFHPGTNCVVFAALDDDHVTRVTKAVTARYQEVASHPGWEKPAVRAFAWPCIQIV